MRNGDRNIHLIMPAVCRSFLKGTCTYDPCKFLHELPASRRTEEGATGEDAPRGGKTDITVKGSRRSNRHSRRPPAVEEERNETAADEYESGPAPAPTEAATSRHRGGGSGRTRGNGLSKLPMPRVNTESFTPSHEPCTMRVVLDLHPTSLSVGLTVRDVFCAPCVFTRPEDAGIYDKLVHEIEHCGIREHDLLKSWHGDSHWIADDSTGWKKKCPTFLDVIHRIKTFFNMDIKATRFNWYKDTSEWKPYHHDAAAVKPDKAKTQNFTVAVSFGATRVAAFEDAKTKTTIAFPQPNGYMYCFSRDTNILWRHGILQDKEVRPEGRISIIAWGWIDGLEEC